MAPPAPLVATQNPATGQETVSAVVPSGVTLHFPPVNITALPDWSTAAQKDRSGQDTAVNAWPLSAAEVAVHVVPSKV